jgi:hypothetical protein
MPYYHQLDNGRVHFWRRKCSVCSKSWPVSALFSFKSPEGMYFAKKPKVEKPETTYAAWADKFPTVAGVASRLPNWPRWARILFALVCVIIAVIVIILVTR